MARRDRRDRGAAGAGGLEAVWEGPEVLDALLGAAGSPFLTEEVEQRFREAQASGAERSDVIPTLFPDEPRFAGPDEARRLYGNLFGLWHRVRAGRGAEDDAPLPTPDAAPPLPPLPERGQAGGSEVPPEIVDGVWRHLDALPERERARARHRFEAAQPDLAAWLQALPFTDVGVVAAGDLAFECWAMLDLAFGDRLGAAGWDDIRALASEPPPLQQEQPVLAGYVAEVLDIVASEDPGFGPAQRAQVERAVATAVAAMGRALAAE